MKLIDKAALVAWAKETYLCENASMIRKVCYKQLLEHLNSLEVEEVDIEEELQRFNKEIIDDNGFFNPLDIAKHFFKLGLRSTITEEDCKLIWNIGDDIPNMPEEEFFKELLRRYKAQKGE